MRVLGLGTEGDSGAAIIEDGRILAAVNEERYCRLKLVVGFPRESIREVLRLSSTDVSDLDAVLVGGRDDIFVDELQAFHGWFQQPPAGVSGMIKRAAGTFARYRRYLPFLETAYYAMLAPSWARRRREIRRILREEFGIRCPVRFVDHHFAHLASAYYTSGFRDALVVSIDGGGDRKSSLVYAVRNGRWEYLHEVSAYNSLGNYYAYATHLCGFKAMKHEGKVTGLAAHGEPKYMSLLAEFIDERNGTLINRAGVAHLGAVRALERRLPRGWTREDLAASIQRHTEELVRRYVRHWARVTGLRIVAMAGGVFANVRVNQEVHELPEVDAIFIHPHMGDGGLPVGAALAACVPGVLDRTMPYEPEPLADVYLGPDLGESQVDAALRAHGLEPEPVTEPIEETIADLLVRGYVVARAEGRMEYGPRALGCRSIIGDARSPRMQRVMNLKIKFRESFRPFAPCVLREFADVIFELRPDADSPYMLFVAPVLEEWRVPLSPEDIQRMRDPDLTVRVSVPRSKLPAITHVDYSARIQTVDRERHGRFYRLMRRFYERTGCPVIVNTSFNIRGEPIVCTPEDAYRCFMGTDIDCLVLENYLLTKNAQPPGLRIDADAYRAQFALD